MNQLHRPRVPRTIAVLVFGSMFAVASSCGRSLPSAPLERVSPPARAAATNTEDEVVVILAPGAVAADLAASFGATVLTEGAGVATLIPLAGETALGLTGRMTGDPRIRTTEQNATLEPAEMRSQEPYASDDGNGSPQTWIEQPAARALNLSLAHSISAGTGVLVAVLDTGVDATHPALATRFAGGWDFVGGDSDPSETPDGIDNDGDGRVDEAIGHGTHVAGIVALTAPGARLLAGRVLDSDGRGDVAGIARAIRWAIDQRARVINLSLGMLRSSDAIQHLLSEAEGRGIVVVSTAGNYATDEIREFPGSSSHAVAIAAAEANASPAGFTSYGSHVAICAPGVGVRSTFPGGGYRIWSGTSMSAPFVSGTAALLLALHPEWGQEQVMDRIDDASRPLVNVPSELDGKLGSGMLDVGAALERDRAPASGSDGPGERLRRP